MENKPDMTPEKQDGNGWYEKELIKRIADSVEVLRVTTSGTQKELQDLRTELKTSVVELNIKLDRVVTTDACRDKTAEMSYAINEKIDSKITAVSVSPTLLTVLTSWKTWVVFLTTAGVSALTVFGLLH